jgi:hypothetical protein
MLKDKDPMAFMDEAKNHWMMYNSTMKDNKHWVVGHRNSHDMYGWWNPQICFDEYTESPGVESPIVVNYGDDHNLLLCPLFWV